MKNTIKMSLVAAVAVAGLTTTSSAGTLAEAFAASKVTGSIDSMYFAKEAESGADKTSSIWVNGGKISVKTASYNGLTAGVTFQTSHVANDNDEAGKYKGDMDASGSVMSEAYLAYTLSNTTLKIGRQYISTPLLAGSGSRMIKESFEAALLVNTDLPNTTIVAGVITKDQKRTDGAGDVGSFNDLGDGAYTVYVKNTSIDNLTAQAQYVTITEGENVANDIDIIYADALYKMDNVTLGLQGHFSDNGANTNSDGTLFGLRAAVNIEGVNVTLGYTTTDDEATVVRGQGQAAYKSFTSAGITSGSDSYKADTDSYLIAVSGKVAGFKGKLSHALYDSESADTELQETNLTVSYAFNSNLSAKVSFSKFDDNASNDYRSRTYLSYKF
jgi:hypothetical protein